MDAPVEVKKRGPGRPPKVQEEALVEKLQELDNPVLVESSKIEDIKHVIRTVNWSGNFGEDQSQPSSVIEDYLNQSYFSQGYVLYSILNLNIMESAGTAFGNTVMYILVKYVQ